MFLKNRFHLSAFVLVLAALACNMPTQNINIQLATPTVPISIPTTVATAVPTVDATRITLQIQATALAAVLTEQAAKPTAEATVTVTETQAAAVPTVTPTLEQAASGDMDSLIKNAKILVYEDAGSVYLDKWVSSSLNLMGLKYMHVGDAQGDFMSQLNSGTKWDLIIVAAESRKGVQGEFWDVITPKITVDKTALIVEMWYLSQIANGRIQALTSQCGIAFQSTRSYVESIYTLDGNSPIFNTPNSGFSLTNYVGYWKDKGADYVRVTGGDATLLAGGFVNEKSRYGVITSCFEGRAIFQTFSTHDYKQSDMQKLWQNYITNTLTNHFKAIQ